MTQYLPRSQWTSTSASGVALSGSSLRGVAVHWPGTSQAAIGTASKSSIANRLRSYRTFHVNTRGWRDIGYTFAIDQAGRVWMLRSKQWHGNLVGAHAASGSNPNANHHYVGVLLLLGASEAPSAAMIAAFRDWYHNRFLPKWPGRTDVRGHGQVRGAQTSCPGSRARAAIGDMIRQPTEDDMPTADEIAEAVVRKTLNLTPLAEQILGEDSARSLQGVLGYAASWPRQGLLETRANGKQLAKLLAGQQAIMQSQGVEVDEAALAQQIAAVLVPAVVAELSDATEEETEAAMERVLRRVLGGLDDA